MTRFEKYDRMPAGLAGGLVLPVITVLIVYLITGSGLSPAEYIKRIAEADIITHSLSLSVLPNLFLFLIFNRLDMLKAARGVLGATIFWALLVFAVKFLI